MKSLSLEPVDRKFNHPTYPYERVTACTGVTFIPGYNCGHAVLDDRG